MSRPSMMERTRLAAASAPRGPGRSAAVRSGAATRSGLALALAGVALAGCPLSTPKHPIDRRPGSVGLDLTVTEGQAKPLTLQLGGPFYIERLALQARVNAYPESDVMDWLVSQSDFSALDWTGLATIRNTWEAGTRGATEQRFYAGAAWMKDKHGFSFEFVDENGATVAGPFRHSTDDFLIARRLAFAWISSPILGGYGGQLGNYSNLEVASSGSFDGVADDIYVVEVATAGSTDGSATVKVRSVRGDNLTDPLPVVSGSPIALGTQGALLTFTASPTPVHLVPKDRWVVRCTAARGDDAPAVVGDATPGPAATFNGLAEVRVMVARETNGDFTLPESTRGLKIQWSHRTEPYLIPIQPAEPPAEGEAVGYGLDVDLQLSPPANGKFYVGGETLQVTLDLKDGAGRPLHAPGFLPTYRQFKQNQSNGLRYYNVTDFSCSPFFAECDSTFLRVGLWGPVHRIHQNYSEEEPEDYFEWENNFPNMSIPRVPTAWDTPIANAAEVQIPEDAFPGTYVALAKVARSFNGESLAKMALLRFQVKSQETTDFIQDVGNCRICHVHDATLDRLRHGTDDWRVCKLCHVPPHAGVAGEVVHEVHFFAQTFPPQRNDCTWCHLTPQSNSRASPAVCGACHDTIHEGELGGEEPPEYDQCAETCHGQPPAGHVQFPPQ